MSIQILDHSHQVDELREKLKSYELISYDLETTGLKKTDEIIGLSVALDENTSYYMILSSWSVAKQTLDYMDGMKESVKALIQDLVGKKLIMHNAPFDCMMTKAFFDIELMPSVHADTLIMAHLLDENRPVGLKALGTQFFGEDATSEQKEMIASITANGGKTTKASYELYKAKAEIVAKYGAKDTLLTYKLFNIFDKMLVEQKLDKFFYEDESMPLLRGPTYQLNTVGLQVDTSKLLTLKKTLEAECMEDEAYISKEIYAHIKDKYPGTNTKNTFNIGSSSQLAWLLFGKLKLEFRVLTKEGKKVCKSLDLKAYYYKQQREFIDACEKKVGECYQPEITVNGKVVKCKKIRQPWNYIAVDKLTLGKLSSKYKWIARLLEYNKKLKLLSTYVEGIEERMNYGIIQPGFKQAGTTSGRYSSSNPNFQNLPRDDKRIKSCITARPGKVFVGADYSQLEPRVFAYVSGDPRLMASFSSDDDFYSVIGIEVFDKYDAIPKKDGSDNAFGIKYKSLRDASKVIALSTTYGSTAYKLSSSINKSVEETQEVIDSYFEKFPGVKKMMLESHNMAKNNGVVYNVFGRPRRMPEAKRFKKLYGALEHGALPYEARNLLNLAVNHRIQSTGASIVNRAAIQFDKYCKEAGIDCALVLQVHDSLVVECNEADAEDVSALLQDAMENTVQLQGVTLEAIPRIGKTLADV